MYNQKEYIYTEFKKNYPDINEPIAIYGIGVDAGNLIPMIPEYNIVGLLDGKEKSGSIHGKDIIDLPDIIEQRVKKIIIVARPAVLGVIYHRIASFASENDIFVGDVRGRNLAKEFSSIEHDLEYFNKDWADLETAVKGHDIVTFDIFDTLLIRKTMQPKDIFRIVELELGVEREYIPDFHNVRITAEDRCYKKGINPTIYQVYDEIRTMTGCSKELSDRYLQSEIKTEKKFLCARKSMLNFFNSIKDNKQIYLISDMYLPSDVLDDILSGCGYTGYKKIYVSCEYGCGKTDGLFEIFIGESELRKNAIHIGDNEISDIRSAENAGLAAFHIMNKTELLENSTYGVIEDKANSLLDKIALGLFCNKAFDDPFVFYGTKGKRRLSDYREIAYLFIAPEILYYSCWLIKNIMKRECDYVVYPSRDAYILQKLCGILVKNQGIKSFPEGNYTYVSRRALYGATTFGQNDIDFVAGQDYRGNTLGVFKDRFNLDLPENENGYSYEKVMEFSHKYAKEILAICECERQNYLMYLKKQGIEQKKKLAFIDFVAAGTVQNGLRKLINNDIEGFYFLKRNTDDVDRERTLKVESFYQPKGDFELDANIYKLYLFFELMLTSPEPTFNYMDDELKPVFLEEKRSDEEIEIVMDMQQEMIDFCQEVSLLHPDILMEDINPDMTDVIVGFMGKEYSDIECEALMSMKLTDEYLSRTFNIFDKG